MDSGGTTGGRIGLGDVVPLALSTRRADGLVIAVVISAPSGSGILPASRLAIQETGEVRGTIHPVLDTLLVAHGRERLREGRESKMLSFQLSEDRANLVGVDGGNVSVFFDVLPRPPRLIIVGAGHIAVPLARMAALLEFAVTIVDDRAEYASRERFPEADDIHIGPYRPALADIPIDADTYIVLVTRGHVHDQACLEQVLGSPAAYIGMIGSKLRVRTVLRHMLEGGTENELARVYAPIGLDIGSHTPAEIAVAIMAEIVNVRRGGRGVSLSARMSSRGK